MKRALAAATALSSAFFSAGATADVSGFVQLRQVQRVESPSGCAVDACAAMVQEALGEVLVEQDLGERGGISVRAEGYDDAAADGRIAVREGFLDWAPARDLDLKLGRQILTWGASEYLYVNDIFPKNYDAFFTGAGFDRMKEPVDAARLAWHAAAGEVEAVVSRAKADRLPAPARFSATAAGASAAPMDDADDAVDAAIKGSAHADGWDLAVYAASFRSRELRYVVDGSGLRSDRPRSAHAGFSVTGNAAGGVAWFEGGVRRAVTGQANAVSRHFLGSFAKLIAGYSREVGPDVTASAQLQIEAATAYGRYVAALAPGVRPVERVGTTLHLRLRGGWMNQTLGAGAQAFVGNEGDSHLNPFASWSPADGWTIEAGANLFRGEPDTRYGALQDDSSAYVLGRYSL